MTAVERLRRGAWIAGGVAALLTLVLIADGIAELGRVAKEKALIEQLEESVLTDASVAEPLDIERELQTQRSVARQARNRRLGWALLVAAGLFLVATKRAQALTEGPAFSHRALSELVTLGTGRSPAAEPAPETSPSPARAAAPSLDLGFVDEVVGREGVGREAAIPILQALQGHYRYLPQAALHRVCELTEVTPADLVGVASFYSQFRSTPVGKHLVRICHGTACHVAGIEPITDELRRQLAIPDADDSDSEMRFTLDTVNCLGCCSLAPVLMVDDQVAGRLTPTSAFDVLTRAEIGAESASETGA